VRLSVEIERREKNSVHLSNSIDLVRLKNGGCNGATRIGGSIMQSEQTVRQNIETAIARIQQLNAEAEQGQMPLTGTAEPGT